MFQELFTDLSKEQQEVVAGGVDFQIDATFYKASENILNGSSYSGPHGSTANSNGRSTDIRTAGLAFLGLDVNHIPDLLDYH
ncbi:MAG: CTB family bacteriocin [Nostoc sp.]|uniref:CTB family bacteriocin n=1 Tax=unclassified Nostoc TaxID=2593658 RepID=UPI001D36E3ED|nr:CTB family bacteriocin [Nostoc sp. JL34]MBN3883100.1 hypothetical protein [Nostoc sp. JL34]